MGDQLYTTFFGFTERPFALVPDPGFLFWSKMHKRAFSVLEYGLMTQAPITVVTGEVGMGKTTLIQALLSKIDEDVRVGLVSNAQGDRGDLLRWLLNALDVPCAPQDDYVTLFQQFQDFVIEEYSAGRRVVLILDEAQNLSREMLEELRMLTNINSGKDELLQLILIGQPELRDILASHDLRQFVQRVTATYHINPMDRETTCNYIRHRLTMAGGSGDEITRAAAEQVHARSEGIPRIVNKLCDLMLVYAAADERRIADIDTLQELLDDGLMMQSEKSPLPLLNPIYPVEKAAE